MDDILILAKGNTASRTKFVQGLIEKAAPFRLVVESVAAHSVRFLDLHIWFGTKHAKTGKLDYKVAHKDSDIHQSLAPTSMHHKSIHKAWPAAMESRARKYCSSKVDSSVEIDLLRTTWNTMDILIPTTPTAPREPPHPADARVVMPFRPEWFRAGLSSALRLFEDTWCRSLRNIPSMTAPRHFGTSWKLAESSVLAQIQVFQRWHHTDVKRYSILTCGDVSR